MCFNSETSFNTFIFGSIIAVILLLLNKSLITHILIVYTITLIQLMEYLAWINIDNNDNNENKQNNIYYLSIIGYFILLIQVLIINISNLKGIERIIIVIIIIILFIYGLYYNYKNNNFRISVGNNGHLIWSWIDIEYLNVFALFFWLYPYLRINDYLTFSFISIVILYSIYNYYKYKTFGTMWCYFSNIVWLFLVFEAMIK